MDETTFTIRFALAEGFGADFAYSELGDKLCAFAERYGLESVLEILEMVEENLRSPGPCAEDKG